MRVKYRSKLLVVLVLLLVGRVVISGSGMLDDSDEVDYYVAESAVDSLMALNLTGGIQALALSEGKPSETIIKMMLVPVHRLWASALGLPRHSVQGLWPLMAFNILVSMGILVAFHRVLLALHISGLMSIVGVGVLGVTVNFNLYTRHLLPYDLGLLFNLLALLAILHADWSHDKRINVAAILASIGFTTYHGHFMFVLIVGGLAFMHGDLCSRWNWRHLRSFILWFAFLPVLYELLFWLGGQSYVLELFKIGGTISQGSYDEGFRYAWLYVSMVEGPMGMAMVALFPVSLFVSLRSRPSSQITRLLVLASVAYISFAFAVQYLNMFVFYGRILHMYLPFTAIGTASLLDRCSLLRSLPLATLILTLLSVQYVDNISDMNTIAYPRKVIDVFGLSEFNDGISFHSELRFHEDYVSDLRFRAYGMRHGELTSDSLVVVNTVFFDHHPDDFMMTHRPFLADGGDTLFSQLHFMSYPAYTLEYCSRAGREFYLSQRFHITVIRP